MRRLISRSFSLYVLMMMPACSLFASVRSVFISRCCLFHSMRAACLAARLASFPSFSSPLSVSACPKSERDRGESWHGTTSFPRLNPRLSLSCSPSHSMTPVA